MNVTAAGTWFHEHGGEFGVLQRPSQSPDLNPGDHLWNVVERELGGMKVRLKNPQELRD